MKILKNKHFNACVKIVPLYRYHQQSLVVPSFVRKYTVWEKKIKMSTASKIFSKLGHNAGVGNGGY